MAMVSAEAESGHKSRKPQVAQLASQILADLEAPPTRQGHVAAKDAQKGKLDLGSIEKRAFETFGTQPELKRATSSPELKLGSGKAAHSKSHSLGRVLSDQIPVHLRGFGVMPRPPIYAKTGTDLSPGSYDTHLVGCYAWEPSQISNPAQKQLSQHKSPIRVTFTTANPAAAQALKLAQSPGPGHYGKPDLWDPNWQRSPPAGRSFVRHLPPVADSRFGSLAKALDKEASHQPW